MRTDLNAKHLCYLTEEAEMAVDVLLEAGICDRDLAIAVLEQLWAEDEIYEIPEAEA